MATRSPTPPRAGCSLGIEAAIADVWSVMTDVARYREWNPFIVNIAAPAGALRPGTAVRLDVRWVEGGSVSTVEVVTRLEPPALGPDGVWRATMEYAFAGWLPRLNLVHGARLQTLEQRPGAATMYTTTEAFHGLLARAVPVRKVQRGFEAHANALRARVESRPR